MNRGMLDKQDEWPVDEVIGDFHPSNKLVKTSLTPQIPNPPAVPLYELDHSLHWEKLQQKFLYKYFFFICFLSFSWSFSDFINLLEVNFGNLIILFLSDG